MLIMPNKALLCFIGLLVFLFPAFKIQQEGINKIQLDMLVRKVIKGKKSVLTGTVYFEKNGRMTTHIKTPEEFFVLNNAKGDYAVYMPRTNQIVQENDYNLSSENNTLYYFLFSATNNTGLKAIGFNLNKTIYKGQFMITKWMPPADLSKEIKEAELVYQNNFPVYLKYINTKGKVMRKTYFYDYKKINYTHIPFSITEIGYLPDGDSTIEKTTFSNMKVNNEVNDAMLEFKIPANAKLVKP